MSAATPTARPQRQITTPRVLPVNDPPPGTAPDRQALLAMFARARVGAEEVGVTGWDGLGIRISCGDGTPLQTRGARVVFLFDKQDRLRLAITDPEQEASRG
jgi:hypothetical protein